MSQVACLVATNLSSEEGPFVRRQPRRRLSSSQPEEAPMKHAWALALVALLIAACGDESAEGDGPATAPTTEQPADDTGFPVTVGTGELSVEIAAPPERIVSLSPTATEMLFAIGADDQVVAADEYSYYPEEAPT